MLKVRLAVIASRVRLGVPTLKVRSGVGWRAREVREDMVMPRGVAELPVEGAEVHTTTELGRRRMTERNCSGAARSAKAVGESVEGWTVGVSGGVTFQGAWRVGDVVKSCAWISIGTRLATKKSTMSSCPFKAN